MQQWLKNVFRLGAKELASFMADKVLLGLIIYCFTLSIYEVATGVKTGVENATVAIVDGDHSILSSRIAQGLLPPEFGRTVLMDRSQVDAAMDSGEITFSLDLPPRLEADLLRRHEPIVQLNIDATAMTQAGLGSVYVQSIIQRETAALLTPALETPFPITLVTRALFNPNLESMWFQSVMEVIRSVTILSILLVGAAVIREREHGTIEHLLVMPVTASEIAAAKIWANGLIILLAVGLSLLLVVQTLLDVPIQGSILLFLGGTAIYLFATTSLGILLATLTRSMPQFGLLAIPVFLILDLLSGSTTPVESMPDGLQTVLQASPAVHFVKLAQAILFRGAGIETVWPQMLLLAGLGLVFLLVALSQFRAMLARSQ
ncbi:ABC transporter permease [Rhodospirillum centenum]|uniref:ABC-2 type transporter, permease protein, putative n=1 Tax=Rhodospirillum centenum (strain ATCC 51521 / SW) TaxID=414684 RepID=B6IXP7_RHOCS|nr:ABC transporter permease [Rhodospirillum centenum]ACJ01071.1 ABC-2 type transporter, permease protein, putative [Rhodospirillum centenum SW]